ncbi:ABC transporter substrate-binding protein [Variovorax sp. WS11]|uniref:ABC transporter substrate-binding protein n=1 Tax=Variovorax sp. WS11 TaxID=1105204 RepID=UPI000D0DDFC7|nr:ABC transporter substrate-binding protein [Variovorax sp. WS11]NDZ17334.1 ABC transporter substrate-binding protein [Variovorax sp. WS11]PSL86126.1 ABC transporter substrate-binding protein [Variovorax sp. WS11]
MTAFPHPAAVLVAASLFACALSAQAQQPPLKLGVIVAATGPAAALGTAARSGALLAQKQLNAAGGRQVQLLLRDDATNPDTALTHANELVRGEKVDVVIALTTTASSIAVGGVTSAGPTPQISLSGIGATIERERKCVVHLAWSQDVNAKAFLGYARGADLKKMGVLYDSAWGTLVYNELKRHAPAYGIELVGAEKFEQGATEATTQAAKLKAARPDVVAVIANTAVPYRDLRRLQMTQPIIGAATAASYEAVNAMGSAADNIVLPEYIVSESPTARQKPFVEMYRKEYGALPKGPALIGWDAVQIASELVRRVGPNATGAQLCAAIRSKFDGVSYEYDFAADDLNGLRPSQLVFSKLVGGKFVPVDVRIAD